MSVWIGCFRPDQLVVASKLYTWYSIYSVFCQVEAIANRLEALAIGLEATAIRLEANAIRLEVVGWRPYSVFCQVLKNSPFVHISRPLPLQPSRILANSIPLS